MPKQFRVEGSYAFFIYYSVFLLLSIAMAAVTFALIEWPFLQLRERWLDHGRKVETAAGTAIPTANSATEAVGA
jgi:peptidoglycan/LPS O-acetylase OafA/YrhL